MDPEDKNYQCTTILDQYLSEWVVLNHGKVKYAQSDGQNLVKQADKLRLLDESVLVDLDHARFLHDFRLFRLGV